MFRPSYDICVCHGLKRLIVVKSGHCQEGNNKLKGKIQKPLKRSGLKRSITPIKKSTKRISFRSKKREILDKQYFELRDQFLIDHPACEIPVEGCVNDAKDIHHLRGRNKYYLDISTWKSACRNCHTWVENNPTAALKKGYIELRLKKYD